VQRGFFRTQFRQLLLNLDRFQARQLAQADFQNIFGLTIREFEGGDQGRFRLVRFADGLDHLLDIEQHGLAAFEDMNPVIDFLQAELRAASHGLEAESDPLAQDVAQGFLARTAIAADHH